jgi:hypothetical protein
MAMNLEQHRGEPSVWDRAESNWDWDAERWLVAALAGAFLVAGFSRRSVAGFTLALGGVSLAWWAAAGVDERRIRRGRVRAVLPMPQRNADTVHEASEESFPASDAPSWTPSTGNTGPAGIPTRMH